MRTFSAQKLYKDKDVKEAVRFAFALDKEGFNRHLAGYSGFEITDDTELENFLNGFSPVGNLHNINWEMFVRSIPFDESKLATAKIQVL